jgi:hypothetical protein
MTFCPVSLYAPGTQFDGMQPEVAICLEHDVELQTIQVKDDSGATHYFQGTGRIINDRYLFERFIPREDFG